MLEIKNLEVVVAKKKLLTGFNLKVEKGSIHVIMGPNGAGKSSFSKAVAGDPNYKIKEGKILYQKKNLLDIAIEKRALMGVFVSFQYPIEIDNISNFEFLYHAYNERKKINGSTVSKQEFRKVLEKHHFFDQERLNRGINEGFSGGERKKYEILQMELFIPKLVILDEIDSGVDVDSLKEISKRINKFKSKDNSIILITHYPRILHYVKPNYVHVLKEGKIVKTGSLDLAMDIEKNGYGSI